MQAQILRHSASCGTTMSPREVCAIGRKDITAATEARIVARGG